MKVFKFASVVDGGHVRLPALAGDGDVLLLAGGGLVLLSAVVAGDGHVLLPALAVLAGSTGKYRRYW